MKPMRPLPSTSGPSWGAFGASAPRRLAIVKAAIVLAAAALAPLAATAGPVTGPRASAGGAGDPRENPHAAIACGDCHSRIPEKGKEGGRRPLDFLTRDPVALCRECHPEAEASHHPVVRKVDRELPAGLPLGAGGEVVCSTCHDVHLKGAAPALLRGFDTGRYAVRMDMCLDCHGGTFAAINPHEAAAESRKCYTCHVGAPGGDNAAVSLRGDLNKACDFCHNVAAKAHPLNVDPLRAVPESLPRGRNGEVMCGTCHDPHGGDVAVHFLRTRYVDFLEAGRYADPHGRNDYGSCLGCHREMATRDDAMRKNLRYGGDSLQICLSCHGGMDSCHPILVRLLPGMKPGADLALSPKGEIACTTCHDPTPRGASGVAMRGRVPGEPVNAICFRCHDKSGLTSRNPHATMADRGTCKFCHDTMTDPTDEEAARVSFISNTRLICLRCHAQSRHPGGIDHMVVPRFAMPPAFRLDGKGKITCTTCHNPHLEVAGGESARRHRYVVEAEGTSLCSICHRR